MRTLLWIGLVWVAISLPFAFILGKAMGYQHDEDPR